MQTAAIEQARASDSDILQELNRNFIRSVQMSDVRWFDQNLSEDFLNSNGDGSLSERADFLVQIGRPCPVSNLCAEDVRIRILGEPSPTVEWERAATPTFTRAGKAGGFACQRT